MPVWVHWGEWERECAAQRVEARLACAPGKTSHTLRFRVPQHRLWDLDDPFLYRLEVILCPGGYEDTYTPLRFPGSSPSATGISPSTGGAYSSKAHIQSINSPTMPVPLTWPCCARDLLYAKSCGFNTVRWIGGTPCPSSWDLCDEIGLMAYEETRAAG